jgi:hypothetical protein
MDEGMRAEAIHNYLSVLRRYVTRHSDWNVTIGLNGPMQSGVEVKVWDGNKVVFMATDPNQWLHAMLGEAVGYLETNLGILDPPPKSKARNRGAFADDLDRRWLDYGYCPGCKSAMGRPCVYVMTGEVKDEPCFGRPFFSTAHRDV